MLASNHSLQISRAARRDWPWRHEPGPSKSLHPLCTTTRYARDQRIVGRGDGGEGWHRVVWGAARLCAGRPEGSRQIVDFLLAGDCLALAQNRPEFVVEAITDGTVVAAYPGQALERHVVSDPRLAGDIREMRLAAAARSQGLILTLGRLTAMGKVSSFLLDVTERLSQGHCEVIVLPMSRYDIADYLALSVETVSRCLTSLKRRGAIVLVGRRGVRIPDRRALDAGGN